MELKPQMTNLQFQTNPNLEIQNPKQCFGGLNLLVEVYLVFDN
jgi:hypothetical protein